MNIIDEFYKMYLQKWNSGTSDLTLEQEAAYLRLCHLMYREHGPIKNNPLAISGEFRCHPNKTRALIRSLIKLGKISITEDGHLTNARVALELHSRSTISALRAQSGSRGGSTRAHNSSKSLKYQEADQANA